MEWVDYVPLDEVTRWMSRNGWDVNRIEEAHATYRRVAPSPFISSITLQHTVGWVKPDEFKIAQQAVHDWE